MKSFSFRLGHLLHLRAQEEELWKLRLGQANRLVEELILGIEETKHEESLALTRYRDPRIMLAAQHYILRMQAERKKLTEQKKEAEKKRSEVLASYTQARQKAEVLRKLRQRHFEGWKREYGRVREMENDDINASRRIIGTRIAVSREV